MADAQGLSYYGDRSVCPRLAMDESDLEKARQELMRIGLIAYQRPLYQVLALDRQQRRPSSQLQSLEQIFQKVAGGAP